MTDDLTDWFQHWWPWCSYYHPTCLNAMHTKGEMCQKAATIRNMPKSGNQQICNVQKN